MGLKDANFGTLVVGSDIAMNPDPILAMASRGQNLFLPQIAAGGDDFMGVLTAAHVDQHVTIKSWRSALQVLPRNFLGKKVGS